MASHAPPSEEELRVDVSDGLAYPLSSFLEVYGEVQGRGIWAAAALFRRADSAAATAGGEDGENGGDGAAQPKRMRLEVPGSPVVNYPGADTNGPAPAGAATPAPAAADAGGPRAEVATMLQRLKALGSGAACVPKQCAVFRSDRPSSVTGAVAVTAAATVAAAAGAAAAAAAVGSRPNSSGGGGAGGVGYDEGVGTAGVCLGPGCGPVANNFLRGLKFSPDGLCMLTNSEDATLRIFDLFGGAPSSQTAPPALQQKQPAWAPVLQMHDGGMVYDFDWYPLMDSRTPATCVFVSTSRGHTLHLWDAYTGQLRTSYRAYDHLDEITAAYSVKFTAGGGKILAGYNRCIRVFDVSRPGVALATRATSKTKKSRNGQRGILSCIDSNPDRGGTYAVGSYAATVCVYEEERGRLLHSFHSHRGGVTQVQFSPDGRCLYAGARRDPHIHCWDLRYPRAPARSFEREAATNQRVSFDLSNDGSVLLSGNSSGRLSFYDTAAAVTASEGRGGGGSRRPSGASALPPFLTVSGFADAATCAAFHPLLPGAFAVGTGQRHFALDTAVDDWSDDSDDAGPSSGSSLTSTTAAAVSSPSLSSSSSSVPPWPTACGAVDIHLHAKTTARNQLLMLSLLPAAAAPVAPTSAASGN